MTTTGLYGSRPVQRVRRTSAELEVVDTAIAQHVDADQLRAAELSEESERSLLWSLASGWSS